MCQASNYHNESCVIPRLYPLALASVVGYRRLFRLRAPEISGTKQHLCYRRTATFRERFRRPLLGFEHGV